jgi:hypothetical protein
MTTVIPTSSCCKSQMPSLNCRYCPRIFASFSLMTVDHARPGDYLKPGEDEIDGLKRRLDDRLAPPTDSRQFNASHGVNNEWEIGDCLAQWWRPNFETFMVIRDLISGFSHRRTSVSTTVSVHPSPYNEAQRVQEIVPSADARTKCVGSFPSGNPQ